MKGKDENKQKWLSVEYNEGLQFVKVYLSNGLKTDILYLGKVKEMPTLTTFGERTPREVRSYLIEEEIKNESRRFP